MRGRNDWKDGRIHHAEAFDPIYPQLRIHHTTMRPWLHAQCADRVRPGAMRDVPQNRLDCRVSLHTRAGQHLREPHSFPRVRSDELTEFLEPRNGDLHVSRVLESAVVEDWISEGIGRVDEDATAAERFKEDQGDRLLARGAGFMDGRIGRGVIVEDDGLLGFVALEQGGVGAGGKNFRKIDFLCGINDLLVLVGKVSKGKERYCGSRIVHQGVGALDTTVSPSLCV